MRLHPLNHRTLLLIAMLAGLVLVGLAASARADAHHSRGFEPTDATLECINRHEGSPAYTEPGTRWNATTRSYSGYATAYQMDASFARTYSKPIPDEHWALWGDSRNDPPWTWDPMIQNETARNGVRDRGLNPWPPSRGRC